MIHFRLRCIECGTVADDPTDLDSVYGAGDILTLTFSMPTDRGATNATDAEARDGGMGLVDRLFAFSTPLGDNYTGAWLDDSTFRVTIVEPTAGADPPSIGITEAALTNRSNVRNRASTFANAGEEVVLQGEL